MPRADKYIASLFARNANKTTVRSRVLSPAEANSLAAALKADAADQYYSGWVSFLDALHGIHRGFYTWATTKLYYALFYTFRASLAQDGICTFHVSRPHFMVRALPGQAPVSCTVSGTHKAVLDTFVQYSPNHILLSQQIELQPALDWLINKRETANYYDEKFSEPAPRPELEYIASNGIRETLLSYLEDNAFLYVFDPDHAMVAYPLRALCMTGTKLCSAGTLPVPSDDESCFLRDNASDRSGHMTGLISEMKRCGCVIK